MTLKRLDLHNYMVLRDFEASFDGNLIALTGEMGHGKSTLVGAIQFCLTGEHPPWHREDLISWGETEGAAKLEFVQDGVECSVLRKLNSQVAVLMIGDERITGARNVEKAMAERLGVDKDILKQIGFVQQYDIQSILFDDPGKRERSFQKLLGIGDANKIWTELGPIIQSYSRTENFDASIEALKQTAARLENDLNVVDVNLKTAKDTLSTMPSKVDQLNEFQRMSSTVSKVRELIVARSGCEEVSRKLESAEMDLAAKTASLEKLKSEVGSVEELEEFVVRLREESAKADAEVQNMRKLSGASDVGGMCPLCGTAVSPGFIQNRMRSELARLDGVLAEARSKLSGNSAMLDTVKRQMSAAESGVQRAKSEMATLSVSVDMHKDKERKLLGELTELGVDPGSDMNEVLKQATYGWQTIRVTVDKYDELSRMIASLSGEATAKRQRLEEVRKMISDKEREKELSAPIARKIDVLTNVRNWFHSSNGPRTMSLSALRAMTGYVNEYLVELHSEIEVVPDNQGLSFAFRYVDGRTVSDPPPSTSKLSGGQKICLALAFRLAIYRYFGQKMGIMVLDEPTAHLSPAGIEYFGTLLQTVSALARNMDLQIVMPTHEKEIMPYMDSEIHLS